MKQILSYLLIVLSSTSFGQVYNLSKDGKVLKSCMRPIENKEVELCNMKGDTLTFTKLKNCKELTVNNPKKQIITSYRLSYYRIDSSIVEYNVLSNQLTSQIISGIEADTPKKIFIEDIIGTENAENIILGHRWFYFK